MGTAISQAATMIILVLLMSTTIEVTLAQTVTIPDAVQVQLQAAVDCRNKSQQPDHRAKQLEETINTIRTQLPRLNEWQYLSQEELTRATKEALESTPPNVKDYGEPFEFGREERVALETEGIDPKKIGADVDPQILILCLEAELTILFEKLGSGGKSVDAQLREIEKQLSELVKSLPNSKRSLLVEYETEKKSEKQKSQERIAEIDRQLRDLHTGMAPFSVDPIHRENLRVRVSALLEEQRQLNQSTIQTMYDVDQSPVDKRTEYRRYIDSQIHFSNSLHPTESETYQSYGKYLLHLDLMAVENGLKQPTDSLAFHKKLVESHLERCKAFSNLRPRTLEQFQEVIRAKAQCLAMRAFLNSGKTLSGDVKLQGPWSLLDNNAMLALIKAPADVSLAYKKLSEGLPKLEAELSSLRNAPSVSVDWKNVRLDARGDWGSGFFNQKAMYQSKPIEVKLWDGALPAVGYADGTSSSKGGGGRGGIRGVARRERSGTSSSKEPEKTGLSSGRLPVNSLRWKVTTGSSEFFLTLAAPVVLNSWHHNQQKAAEILEYVNHENRLAEIDCRLASEHATVSGLRYFAGPSYRPSHLHNDGFIPTYVTIPWREYQIGFVVTQIGPGSADIDLVQVLAALLAK